MGMALYRKYRSKRLSEIVGQEHIAKPLETAIREGAVSHAYLFTGPRGVGKTSIARILAHEVNQLPYDEQSTHLDIIEIDAASNRRIDEIRELRDKVHVAPTSAKFKVYIIDEVHMLTREAFNALLKTLEEPPAHVIFILATTELHKLPETIVSRTQHFAFKPVTQQKVVAHLAYIAKQEKIDIDKAGLELIAEHGDGSFRDSIGLLDKIQHYGSKITANDIESILGIAPTKAIDEIIAHIVAGNSPKLIITLETLREHGIEPSVTSKQLAKELRAQLLQGDSSLPAQSSIALLEKLVEVPSSVNPFIALELALLKACLLGQETTGQPVASSPQVAPKSAAAKIVEPDTKIMSAPAADPVQKPKEPTAPRQQKQSRTSEAETEAPHTKPEPASEPVAAEEAWPKVLEDIKKNYNTMHSMLRQATADFHDDALTLSFRFPFHQRTINEARNKKALIDLLYKYTGQSISISCTVEDKTTPAPAPSAPQQTAEAAPQNNEPAVAAADSPASAITNIFGGGEILES